MKNRYKWFIALGLYFLSMSLSSLFVFIGLLKGNTVLSDTVSTDPVLMILLAFIFFLFSGNLFLRAYDVKKR